MSKKIKVSLIISVALLCVWASGVSSRAQKAGLETKPVVLKTWDDAEVASSLVPLAQAGASPAHVKADYYYRIPVRPIYKTYPIYAPGKEPPGYLEWLKKQEPETIEFDVSKFKTQEDWIKAGEMVFDTPIFYESVPSFADVRNPAWYERVGPRLTRDGVMPFARYVIREKGTVEVGNVSCAECHTRVMDDGTVIKGAQGNFPFDRADAWTVRRAAEERLKQSPGLDTTKRYRIVVHAFYGAPWVDPDPVAAADNMSLEELTAIRELTPPGVMARAGSSIFFPPKIPDLIGIKDIRYLDATGLIRHRSPADMMRYAAFNQGADELARYGDFSPFEQIYGKDPEPDTQDRYSDEQLYALAMYLYSLKPPPNPNKFDALAAKGKKVFESEGCAGCHTPPLYTNNKLMPVEGFKPPAEDLKRFDVMPMSVGTDPNLALKSRRGTGYYKVPSLRGLWYRGPFEHNGSVATLEDWFDPRRTRADYVPTGFVGYRVKTRAVKGHLYGLSLSDQNRKALIAFLKTL
jgi:hypothetical protein